MKTRANLIIDGRVQGVAYRYFVRDIAYYLGLTGWVKNLHDGKVEAVFEGDKEKIEEAIMKCRQGPPLALVTEIEVEWENHTGAFSDFSIRFGY
jgi:acylphosphatase